MGGRPLTDVLDAEQIDALVERTREGGAEIVGLLKTGSAYFAPSSAAAQMVAAVLGDTNEVLPVCAWVEGEYGIDGVYLGVPARIGAGGVTEIVELPLTDDELNGLRAGCRSGQGEGRRVASRSISADHCWAETRTGSGSVLVDPEPACLE